MVFFLKIYSYIYKVVWVFIPVIMLAKPTVQPDALVEGVGNNLFDTVMTGISINAERIKKSGFF